MLKRASGGSDGPLKASRRLGLSLIEAMVATTIVGTTAVGYAAVFRSQVTQHKYIETMCTATQLYMRQVELLRQISLRDGTSTSPAGANWVDTAFSGCPAPTAGGDLAFDYGANSATQQLEPYSSASSILTSSNSYVFPTSPTRAPALMVLPRS